jgi:hypothetical protein
MFAKPLLKAKLTTSALHASFIIVPSTAIICLKPRHSSASSRLGWHGDNGAIREQKMGRGIDTWPAKRP